MERSFDRNLAPVLGSYFSNPEEHVFLGYIKPGVLHIQINGGEYVLKRYPPNLTQDRLTFFESLQNFSNEKIGISPHILETSDQHLNVNVNRFQYDITDFVKFAPLERDHVQDVNKFFFEVGSFVGLLHHTFSEFKSNKNYVPNAMLKIDSNPKKTLNSLLGQYTANNIDDSWGEIIKNKIRLTEKYSRVLNSFSDISREIVHGDLHLKNILLNDKQEVVGLIDFARAGLFYKCYEIMRSAIQTNLFIGNKELDAGYLQKFLDGYLSKQPLKKNELECMLDLYIYTQAADIFCLDLKTLKSKDEGSKRYAIYRFNSLMTLDQNYQSLKGAIQEFI